MRGLWCALLTPLQADGTLDASRLVSHARLLLEQGIDGVVPFGTTGEGPSFSVAERQAGLEALLAGGVPARHIAVAVGCAALPDTAELTRHALANGCVRCLALPPFFYREIGDAGVHAFYSALIDGVGDSRLRLYLYNLPQSTAAGVSPHVAAELATANPEVVAGIKDSSCNWSNTQAYLRAIPQLSVLSGFEPDLPRLMRAGGAGTVCGVANFLPALVRDLLRPGASARAASRVRRFLETAARYSLLPAFKALLAAQSADPAWLSLRPPLMGLDSAARGRLLGELRGAGFTFGRNSPQ
jgi:4-hydroxy-tetrahydrodipicolinate synthase